MLPKLPYDTNALSPHISKTTLEIHHGKHHATYVTNLNNFIEGTDLATLSLAEVIKSVAGDAGKMGVFNNAAQVWNHNFYWKSMKEDGGGKPTGDLAAKINDDFGSYDDFVKEFKQACMTQFGSGWAWLALEGGKLKITKTGNADTPMVHNQTALLTCDVWEHAYYLDYQNRRADYADVFLESLANWDFAAENLEKAI